jgi:hypothetical protein
MGTGLPMTDTLRTPILSWYPSGRHLVIFITQILAKAAREKSVSGPSAP